MRPSFALFLVLAACGGVPAPVGAPPVATPSQAFAPSAAAPSFQDRDRAAKLAAAYAKLDEYFVALQAKTKVPGVSVGLVEDGRLVWSKGYGVIDLASKTPADIDSVYRIGSITKMFTATTAVRLRDLGKLSLEAPVSNYLPEFADVVYATADSPRTTIRQLITHTGGLPDIGDPGTEGIGDDKHTPSQASVLGCLRGLPLLSAPGAQWSYSGVGYALLGLSVGRVWGKAYRDAVTELILRPLGMTATAWDPESVPRSRLVTAYEPKQDGTLAPVDLWKFGAMEPAGGLYSSVRDMARFLALNLEAWPARSDPDSGPIARSSLREMHRLEGADRIVVSADKSPHTRVDGYGLGWQTTYACGSGLEIACTGGTEGQTAFLFGFPERGVGMVILTNVRDVSWRGVSYDVWRILDATGGLGPRALADGGTAADPWCSP